ncbi:MAG TPA: DUF4350 domain-containing protein [Flavobacteriales bacterium]|nr:DUF4350 domain-containing protein [Flavobacteriales bacterium]
MQQSQIFSRIFLLLLLVQSTIASGQKTVLFDELHGQFFSTEKSGALQLSGLSDVFKEEGWMVKTCDSEITDEVLAEVDALIITGAFKPVTLAETEAISRFIENGGKLSVMLHIASPFEKLLYQLNVFISNGVIHEVDNIVEGNDINFKVVDLKPHDLFHKLEQFNLYGGWALMPVSDNVQIIAQTSEKAWIDLNGDLKADAQQAFGTIVTGHVGKGDFVVFSDDAIFQNQFLKDDNYQLGKNLANWLSK